jgi:hypothetical protein
MWVPRTWPEVDALTGTAEESSVLDFKRDLPPATKPANEGVAKDIAAMSVAGGVILYGVEEDAATLVATGIRPVVLAGARERFQQIAGSRIAPGCVIEVVNIADPSDRTKGVVAVAVPPSVFAPHMVGDRFPVRRGTVTESLSEPDIARLYARREAMLDTDVPEPRDALAAGFAPPRRPDDGTPDRAGALTADLGRLRVAFLPVGPVAHPAAPWLRDVLQAAHRRAVTRVLSILRDPRPAALTRLASWEPYYGQGWTAGRSASFDPTTRELSSHAAVFAYPGRLSFQATRMIRVSAGASLGVDVPTYLCAYEDDFATSMIAFAGIAGQVFADMDGVGMIRAVIEFLGFDGAVPFADTDGARIWGAPIAHIADATTDAAELRDDPAAVAQRLVDPWLAAFCDDASVWSRISQ